MQRAERRCSELPSMTLYLVAGGKMDAGRSSAPAAEMYSSDWFKMAKAYVEPKGPWLILSAKYGVLKPTDVIEPYQEMLRGKDRAERETWGVTAAARVLQVVKPGDTVVILAGEPYREFLLAPLEAAGLTIDVPMFKLAYGNQMLWLTRQLKAEGIRVTRATKEAARERREREPLARTGVDVKDRLEHLRVFYGLLGQLAQSVGGARLLRECHSRMAWPERGVYFLFETGEERRDSGPGPRVVRVGTHAIGVTEGQSFWTRIQSHKGTAEGGRHRASVFRRLVGLALAARDPGLAVGSWAQESGVPKAVLDGEQELEKAVSRTVGEMSLLWLDVYDAPSAHSLRGYIERNSIALLSNAGQEHLLDTPSDGWLGYHCPRPTIQKSGLWNSDHVDDKYDPSFLETLKELVTAQLEGRRHGLELTYAIRGSLAPEPPLASPQVTVRRRSNAWEQIAARLPDIGSGTLSVTFDEVERWAVGGLPPSARIHAAWWTDKKRSSWTRDGWRAKPNFAEGTVTFIKV